MPVAYINGISCTSVRWTVTLLADQCRCCTWSNIINQKRIARQLLITHWKFFAELQISMTKCVYYGCLAVGLVEVATGCIKQVAAGGSFHLEISWAYGEELIWLWDARKGSALQRVQMHKWIWVYLPHSVTSMSLSSTWRTIIHEQLNPRTENHTSYFRSSQNNRLVCSAWYPFCLQRWLTQIPCLT